MTQFFERGAKGYRYINLGALPATGHAQIELKGNHIAVKDQTATFISLKKGL
jgi:hypothetical protein